MGLLERRKLIISKNARFSLVCIILLHTRAVAVLINQLEVIKQ